MCGIAGIMGGPAAPPVSFEELRRMIAVAGHRGPDGHGFYRDDHVGLAHARLSLVDLAGGFQPIRNGDGSLWLVFNGEIFNYMELRKLLSSLGHHFYTSTDSEVIVHCYERYGAGAWEMFNGQFAFALWDARRRLLWLVRDRLGILPLHYAKVGDHLVFASEMKSLFAGGRLSPRFSSQGLVEIFTTWSASPPRTPFEGVSAVPPATALSFDHTLQQHDHLYWQPDPHGTFASGLSSEQAVDRLASLLDDSVTLRLRADVPVGAYVSGGVDSSLVAGLAKTRVSTPLETFGIRFDHPQFDETDEQRTVVRHLGTTHHEFLCDGAAIRDALDQVVWHCETPLLRTSPVPLFLLSKQVQASGIRTVLTGEGADELLAGYTIFKEDQIRRFWARQPESRLRPLLLTRIHHYVGGDEARATGLWQHFFRRGLSEVDHPFYSHLIRWKNTAWTLRLLTPDIGARWDLDQMMAEAETAMPAGWRRWDPLTRAQWIEIRGFMSSYLLSCQGDRVAMAHGIEARYPYLDPQMVDFCLALPKHHKLAGQHDKILLRRLAARHLPDEIWARRKRPFRAPIGPALFGPAATGFRDLLCDDPGDDLLDKGTVNQLLSKAYRGSGQSLSEREEMGLVGVLTLRLLGRSFGEQFTERVQHALARFAQSPLHILVDQACGLADPAPPLLPAINQRGVNAHLSQ